MKISARGWARDHGDTVILSRKIKDAKRGPVSVYTKNVVYVSTTGDDGPGTEPDRVNLKCSADIKLSGVYQIEVSLSREDLDELFVEMSRHSTYADMIKRHAALL